MCTALLNAALGSEKVIAVHIDNGFMRKNESEHVKRSLEALGLKPYGEEELMKTTLFMHLHWLEIVVYASSLS